MLVPRARHVGVKLDPLKIWAILVFSVKKSLTAVGGCGRDLRASFLPISARTIAGRGFVTTRILSRTFWRKLAMLAYDVLASAIAFYLALDFSYGLGLSVGNVPGPHVSIIYTVVFGGIAGIFIWWNGLHRGIWRYSSFQDFVNILRVSTLSALCFLPFAFLTVRAALLPRTTPLIAWFLMVALVGGPRILCRTLNARRTPFPLLTRSRGLARHVGETIPILICGDTTCVEPFVREINRRANTPYLVTGILSEDTREHGRLMLGIPVLGGVEHIRDALAYLKQRGIRPQRLIIADDNIDETQIARLLETANNHGLTLGRVPRLTNLEAAEAVSSTLIRPIALGDLLSRPQVTLNREAIENLVVGKRVLITGAGGSIGSELVRQISDLNPSELCLLDNSEFNLYSIERELAERHSELSKSHALCDIRDRANLNHWMAKQRPDVVFHAAALKHVPLVEQHPLEGIRTNVLGTQNVADACVQYHVEKMILISSDKAVNPHNVMGATKRVAEAYCQALDGHGVTRFLAVRFGNVLGSAGSVVPLFQRQLTHGGPLTVTHPEVTRYFMTIPEAVALVLQTAALGSVPLNARGGVYVLDMGEPIKIVHLAKQMIRLAGKRPDIDVKIQFIGLRPGEKLFEELVHRDESSITVADGVMMVSPRTAPLPILRNQFAEIVKASEILDEGRALRLLSLVVPEFQRESAEEIALPG
jgi:FlaA1/EpsC-like NDP-sugar epimerase